MPKKEKKDRPIFKGRSHKSFLNQCRLKLVTLDFHLAFGNYSALAEFDFACGNLNFGCAFKTADFAVSK